MLIWRTSYDVYNTHLVTNRTVNVICARQNAVVNKALLTNKTITTTFTTGFIALLSVEEGYVRRLLREMLSTVNKFCIANVSGDTSPRLNLSRDKICIACFL